MREAIDAFSYQNEKVIARIGDVLDKFSNQNKKIQEL